MPKPAYVYILASRRHGTLYTGVTGDLVRRLHQHRQHLLRGFTGKYEVTRPVWFVQGEDIAAAIALEKKIKNRARKWKTDLIERENPERKDLAEGWMVSGSCDCAPVDSAAREAKTVVPRAVAECTPEKAPFAGVDPATSRRMTSGGPPWVLRLRAG